MKAWAVLIEITLMMMLAQVSWAQEYFTLVEVQAQAVQGWHETYTDKYGRTVPVDIEVEVFGKEYAPILRVGVSEYEEYVVRNNTPFESDRSIAKSGGKRTFVERMSGQKIDMDRAYGADYKNDITPREVFDFLNELLAPLELTIEDFEFERPEGFDVITNIKKTNGEVISSAFYVMQLCHKMREIPIFTHASFSVKAQRNPIYAPKLHFQMRNSGEYKLYLESLVEQDEVVGDIPLCSLETVIEKLESKIEEGYIQGVEALRFGYVLYNDPNYKGSGSAFDAECFYAVPSWIVTCIFSPNPKETVWDEEKLARRIEEGYQISDVQRYMVINAQTGEMIDYFDRSKGGKADTDYKGFIAWEDVE